MEDIHVKIKTDCWNYSLDCCGFTYIYAKKIEKIVWILNLSKVFGILIPVLLGGILSTYNSNKDILSWAVIITAPFAIGQLILSTYYTIIGADDRVMKYTTKSVEYSLLNSEFEHLAKYHIADINEYSKKYEILLERNRGISKANTDLKDSDLRLGMRYALRNYRRVCAGCNTIPVSMTTTNCDVCGNF